MFDSSFDSEQSISIGELKLDSGDDSKIVAELEAEQLVEKNTSLIKENNILKSQFEQAVKNTEQISALQKENTELVTKLREISQEKEDLKKRLELCVKSQNELNQKLQSERKSKQLLKAENEALLHSEIKKTKSIYKTQFATLYDQVQSLQENKETEEINQKMQAAKISKCVEAAKRFFQSDINDLDEITELFDRSKQTIQAPKEVVCPQNESVANDNGMKKELKKTKATLKQMISKTETLEAENQELRRKVSQFEVISKKHADDYQEKISKLNEEIKTGNEDHERELNSMKNKIDSLTSKISKQQQKPAIVLMQQPKAVDQPKCVVNNKENDALKEQIVSLQQSKDELSLKIDSLTRDIKLQQKQKERIEATNHELENQKNAALKSCQEAKDELVSLKTIHDESIKEIETLRTALGNIKDNKQDQFNSIVKKEFRKQKTMIKQLEANNEAQKSQITGIENEKASIEEQLKKSKQEIERMKCENGNLQDTINSLQSELADERIKFERKNAAKDNDVIPDFAWNYSNFNEALRKQISKVAENSSLKPASKIQAIYKIIQNYYKKQINARDKALNEVYSSSEDEKEKFSEFLVSLSIALTRSPMTYDAFKSGDVQILIEAATNLNKTNLEISRELDMLHAYADTFNNKFGIEDNRDLTSMTQQVVSLSETIAKKAAELKKIKKQCSDLKKKVSESKDSANNAVRSKDTEICRINDELLIENQRNQDLSSKVASLQRENQSLKIEQRNLKDTVASLQSEVDALKSDNKELKEAQNSLVANTQASIRGEYTQEIQSLNETIEEQRRQIDSLKSSSAREKMELRDQIEDIQNKNEELEHQVKDIASRNEEERNKVIRSYEAAIARIKVESEAQRNDILSLSQQLSSSEQKNKTRDLSVLKVKKEKAALEKEMRKQKEEFEREKKIIQARSQTSIASLESEAEAKIGEANVRFDKEKKRILSFVVSQLGSYSVSATSIDENTMKNCVFNAREKLEKLSKTDEAIRRMIHADDDQNTDEAVAQLMLQN